MGMNISNEVVAYGVPIWQGRHVETAQGGFTLDAGPYSKGDVIKGGSPFGFDESTRKATKVLTATLTADAADDATKYDVKKGHGLAVGDYVGATEGGAAYAISAIDTSNADYDELTLGTTLGVALIAGTALFQSSATGATAAAVKTTARGLLYEDITITGGNQDVAIVIRGTVYENRIDVIPDAVKSDLPATILFSQSY